MSYKYTKPMLKCRRCMKCLHKVSCGLDVKTAVQLFCFEADIAMNIIVKTDTVGM